MELINYQIVLILFYVPLASAADRSSVIVEERTDLGNTYRTRKLVGQRRLPTPSKYYIARSSQNQVRGSADPAVDPDVPSKMQKDMILDNLQSESGFRVKAIGNPVTGMRKLMYDEQLENTALLAAMTCSGKRGSMTEKPDVFADVLETTFVTEEKIAPMYDAIILQLYSEGSEKGYKTTSGECTPDECYNYKGMMYHDNKAVGCATVKCSEIDALENKPGFVSVCLFGAATKYDFKSKAYDAGDECVDAKCPTDQPKCDALGLCADGGDDPTGGATTTTTTTTTTTATTTSTTTTATTTTTAQLVIPQCVDEAKVGCTKQLCDRIPGEFLGLCRKTCQNCQLTECRDSTSFNCKRFATTENCQKFSDDMLAFCPLSCNLCRQQYSAYTAAPETQADCTCTDTDTQCAQVTQQQCDMKPGYYLKTCPSKCGNCNGAKCYDSQNFFKCGSYTKAYCTKTKSLADYCPKLCGTCPTTKQCQTRRRTL